MTTPQTPVAARPVPLKVRIRDWLQLCRAPNAFTAMADPLAGALICGAVWQDIGRIVIVMVASACLYAGGIVLNDWHDYKRDLRERPYRPLPSKRIARFRALIGAIILFLVGQMLSSALESSTASIGLLLIVSILIYDIFLKEVPLAPAMMGLCRSLNLAMGMSIVTDGAIHPPRVYLAFALGIYILGITVFARREAGLARKDQLVLGAAFTGLPLVMLALMIVFYGQAVISMSGFIWLGLLAVALGYRMMQAILTPAPARIQAAVKLGVLGVILFDASIVGFYCGLPLSLLVAVLLIPAVWAGKWLYST